MATLHARTVGPVIDVLMARRSEQSLSQWATEAVRAALNGGNSTAPATGSGEPLEHIVTWTHDGGTYETMFTCYGSQQELDDAVTAFKAAIVAAGGSIVSG